MDSISLCSWGTTCKRPSRYEDAIETYEEILKRYPNSAKAPFVEQSLIKSLRIERRPAEADALQTSFVDRYGKGSAWYEANKNPELRKEVDTLLWTIMNNEILAHHRAARENKDPAEYDKALALYRKTLAYFPMDENLYETQFRYAECLYESGRFEEAAVEYGNVARIEPFDKYREQAASKRIQSLEGLRDQGKIGTAVLIAGYADYVKMNPDSEKTPLLLFKQGEVLFNDAQYDQAAAQFSMIIQKYPELPQAAKAWTLELESLFHSGRYPELEIFATQFLTQPFRSPRNRKTGHVISCGLPSSNRPVLHRTPETSRRPPPGTRSSTGRHLPIEIAPDALFNAAVCYKEIGDWPKASACFEEITLRYPDSKHYEAALLAPLPTTRRQASMTRSLPSSTSCTGWIRTMNWPGNRCSRLASTTTRPASAIWRSSRLLPTEPDTRRISSGASRSNICRPRRPKTRATWPSPCASTRSSLAAYSKAKASGATIDLDPSYVAHAQYTLLQPRFQQYESIRLVAPPQEEPDPQAGPFLTDWCPDYMKVVKTGQGEYALASAYSVGLAYEDFWESLLHSELPSGMSEEETGLYKDMLNEQAAPYRQKAIDAYRATLNRATEQGLFNAWVLKAYGQLATLDQALLPSSASRLGCLERNLERKADSALQDRPFQAPGPFLLKKERNCSRRWMRF